MHFMRSPHTSYRWRGERVIEAIKWMRSPHTSYRWRGERVMEPIKCMRSPHISYRWRGERVIEAIKCMRSPHTSYRCRGESQSSVCAQHTTATGGEEREVIEPIKWCSHHNTSYRWREEERVVMGQSSVCAHPTSSYRWRGEREHRANQVYALNTQQLQVERRESHRSQSSVCAHHTPATGGEERERVMEPIKCMCSPHSQLQVERRERHRANQVYALTTHQLRWRERES